MRQVQLHGEMAERFGSDHFFDIVSPVEAIRALKANHKDFESYLVNANYGFHVLVDDQDIEKDVNLFYPVGRKETIHIIPAIHGSKNGGLKVFIGAVLIAAAVVATGGAAAPAAGSWGAAILGGIQAVGVGLALQGLAELLTKTPKKEKFENDQRFGPTNVTQEGVPVPVGYGRMIVGSVLISTQNEIVDKTKITDDSYYTEGEAGQRVYHEVIKVKLKNKSFIHFVDLLSEGEIEGLVDGASSIFLNEVPVFGAQLNYEDVQWAEKKGTNSQTRIKNTLGASESVPVAQELLKDIEHIYTVSDAEADGVHLVFALPAFYKPKNAKSQDLIGTNATVKIYLQSNGGGYVLKDTHVFSGKTTAYYQEVVEVPFSNTTGPWDVKVVRTSDNADTVKDDEDDATNFNQTYLESYNIIYYEKLTYPNSAYIHTIIPSDAFNGTPSRAFDVKLMKIKIPSNASVRADGSLTYSGSWDGTFQTAWSSNPAWVLYDMMTNTRYGCGGFLDAAKIDKWALYTIGQYCDELIPNGFDSTEPRFSCNILITERKDAYNLLNNLASVFRGMLYWSVGQVTATQDAPKTPTALFTTANVIEGVFNYEGSSLATRRNVVHVAWQDPNDFYRQKIEVVEDRESIALFGVRQAEITATGCTSRGQARRFGKWLLYVEQYETEVISFATGLEGAVVRPSDIIKIADPVKAGDRFGGRIVSATTTQITVDDATDAASLAIGATLSVMLEDGSVEGRTVSAYSTNVFTVSTAFSSAPKTQAVWVLEPTSVEAQLFRVVSVGESEGKYNISAVTHNISKYDFVDYNNKLEIPDITLLDEVPSSPEDLDVVESLYAAESKVAVKLSISFKNVPSAVHYIIQYSVDDDNFITMPPQFGTSVEILEAREGLYNFFVYAVNPMGRKSIPSHIEKTVYGKLTPPKNVANFSMVPSSGLALLTWDKSEDLDVLIGGFIEIRHTPRLTGQDWQDAIRVGQLIAGNQTQQALPLLEGTYMAKFLDSSGNYSSTYTQIITTAPSAFITNVVETIVEEPSFLGGHSGTLQYTPLNALVLNTNEYIDDYSSWDDIPFFDWNGGVVPEGTYTFDNTVDLGAIYTSRITATIKTQSFLTNLTIDDVLDFDIWTSIDGDGVDDVNAVLYMRTTEDDTTGSPTWTAWKPFFVAEYLARGYEFKLVLTSGNPVHNIAVTQLQVVIDMPDRIESFYNITSGAGVYTLTYNAPFRDIPVVGITGKNLQSGDFWTVTNQTESGCDITFKNGVSNVSRTFDAIIRGYGLEV